MEAFTGPNDPCYIALLDQETEARVEKQRQEQIWATHVGQVLDNLWIGDRFIAYDEVWLNEHNVDVVVNCTAELPKHTLVPYYYQLPLEDGEALTI